MTTLAPAIRPYFAQWTFRCRWARLERRPQELVNDVIPVVLMGQRLNCPIYDILCDHPNPSPEVLEIGCHDEKHVSCMRIWLTPEERVCPDCEEALPEATETTTEGG
jgi:hypothetical protein